MVQQIIDTTTDHGTYKGDPGKTAFEKTKANFAELYQLFQTAANKLGYFDSNGKPAFTDITDFARALLDDGNAATARGTLGLGSAAVAAILGAVSMSGGVATGAIMQTISNANGDGVRLANGTQACWGLFPGGRTTGTAGVGNIYYDNTPPSMAFPAAFAAAPKIIPFSIRSDAYFSWCVLDGQPSTTASGPLRVVSPINTAVGFPGYIAIGSWV